MTRPLLGAGALALASIALGASPADTDADPMRIFEPRIGAWQLSFEILDAKGAVSSRGSGVETYAWTAGGKWLLVDFEGELAGEPYASHGVTGYDAKAERYVSYFFDPYLELPTQSEGTWDPDTATLTKWSDGKDFAGAACRWKQVQRIESRASFTLDMFAVYADGREVRSITCRSERLE